MVNGYNLFVCCVEINSCTNLACYPKNLALMIVKFFSIGHFLAQVAGTVVCRKKIKKVAGQQYTQ